MEKGKSTEKKNKNVADKLKENASNIGAAAIGAGIVYATDRKHHNPDDEIKDKIEEHISDNSEDNEQIVEITDIDPNKVQEISYAEDIIEEDNVIPEESPSTEIDEDNISNSQRVSEQVSQNHIDQGNHNPTNTQQNPQIAQISDEVETDPDHIAEAIIAGEEIDPNDVEIDSLVTIQGIGTVQDEDGTEYHAATFIDPEGNELVMVDIDGDHNFDTVTTTDLQESARLDPEVNITVDDALLAVTDPNTYLPPSENDAPQNLNINNINQDLIS